MGEATADIEKQSNDISTRPHVTLLTHGDQSAEIKSRSQPRTPNTAMINPTDEDEVSEPGIDQPKRIGKGLSVAHVSNNLIT